MTRVVPPALAALAGASAWISLGQLAVLDARAVRVAAMPPLWWLAILVVAATGVAMVTRLSLPRAWPLALSLLLWLPYLPAPIPAVFLLWQGPLEALVWLAIAGGVVFARTGEPRPPTDARRAPLIAASIAAAAYAMGAWSLADLLPGGDEPHYLVIAQSLLLDGDLRIENNHDRGDYRAYTDQPLKPDFIQRGVDGEIYPMHSPGTSALVLPAFAVAGYPGAVATVIALTAAASAVAWHTAWLVTASTSGAWTGWAAVFLTAPFFFHGFSIYPDGVAGLFTMVGVWLLVMLDRGRTLTVRQLAAAGAALSVLPWLHARFALIAAALGGAIVLRLLAANNSLRRVTAFLAIPAVVAGLWFLYFWIIWGTPNPSAPQGRDLMMAVGQIWIGAAGLLFDQQFGLASHAPAYALAFLGAILLVRQHPRLAAELMLATLPYVIVSSSFAAWWGGVSAPARYLSAVMPIAVLPIALWWRDRSADAWRMFTLLLVGLSIAMVIPMVAASGGLLAYNDRAGFDLLLEWASSAVDLPAAFPSVHRQSLSHAAVVAAAWVAAGGLLAGLAWALSDRPVGRAATWTLMSTGAAVVLMAAITAVWTGHGINGLRPGLSQWAFLTSWRPSPGQFMFQLEPVRRLSADGLSRRLEVSNLARVAAGRDSAPVLRAPMLPAGEYDLLTSGEGMLQGELSVQVGRTDLVERWPLQGRSAGFPGFTLRLPVPVHSVTLRADEPALALGHEFRLRVRSLTPPAIAKGSALRAVRYGATRAFFMDDSSYAEAVGFWTRGEEATTLALETAGETGVEELMLLVRSGPVPTRVDLTMGTWSRGMGLAANQLQAVSLPAQAGGVRVVTIRTGAWFRPGDHDSGSRDTRRLGVFVSLP